jgi:hypothetical protein
MEEIKSFYSIKSIGPPEYYLGNDYKLLKGNRYAVGCKRDIWSGLSLSLGTSRKGTIAVL